MIAFLEGTVLAAGTEAVIAVGGIGLDVHFSALAAGRLPAPGGQVRIWTHLAVREDAWSLYGFLDEQERSMFRLLITVAGIGPKVALGMLSRAEPRRIALMLSTGDEKALAALPGIGKKSAARLVVELGQRVQADLPAGGAGDGAPVSGLQEAVAVLGAMGLQPAAAESALKRALGGDPGLADDLEAWIRQALRNI